MEDIGLTTFLLIFLSYVSYVWKRFLKKKKTETSTETETSTDTEWNVKIRISKRLRKH